MNSNKSAQSGPAWWRILLVAALLLGFLVGYANLQGSVSKYRSAQDLALDGQGNFYVADNDLNEIDKYNSRGDQIATIGNRGKQPDQFDRYSAPRFLTADQQGNVFAGSSEQTYLQKFDVQGHFQQVLELGRQPISLLTDSRNHLFVLFDAVPFVVEYDNAGQKLATWQDTGPLTKPAGFTRDDQDNFYLVSGNQIYKFDHQGHFLSQLNLQTDQQFEMIALDKQGGFYLTQSYESYQVYKFDAQGRPVTNWNGQVKLPGNYTYGIRALQADQNGNLYTLCATMYQTFIYKFDGTGQVQTVWSFGFPSEVGDLVRNSGWIMGILVGLLIRFVWIAGRPAKIKPEDTEPLPGWVETGQNNPRLLYDHLDLAKLGNTPKKQTIQIDNKLLVSFTVFFIAAVIIAVRLLISASLDYGFSLDWWLVVLVGVLVVSGVISWRLARSQVKQKNQEKLNQEALIRQVQGTFPVGNRAIMIARRDTGIQENQLPMLVFYGIFYLPGIMLGLATLVVSNQVGWFAGWPVWLFETVAVGGLLGLGLVCLWLVNRWQKEGPGLVRLNRAEMGDLQRQGWLLLAIFAALTIGLGYLADLLAPPATNHYSTNAWPYIFAFGRYIFLIVGLIYVGDNWWSAPLEKGEYEAALRRVVYLRRRLSGLYIRLQHAEILRLMGRLAEAEYVLQEALAKDQFQQTAPLARILGALGLIRLYQERYAEAMFLLENAIQLNPIEASNYDNLAEIYLWLNHRPDRALELLAHYGKDVNKTRKSNKLAEWLLNTAWAQAQRGDWAQTDRKLADVFQKSKSKRPAVKASLHLRAGLVLQLKGDYQAAMENYQQATTLDPAGYHGQKAAEYLAYNRAALPTT